MGWTVTNFIALAIVFSVLAILSSLLRLWARSSTKAKFGVDDILIIPALVSTLAILLIGDQNILIQLQITVLGIGATMVAGMPTCLVVYHTAHIYLANSLL